MVGVKIKQHRAQTSANSITQLHTRSWQEAFTQSKLFPQTGGKHNLLSCSSASFPLLFPLQQPPLIPNGTYWCWSPGWAAAMQRLLATSLPWNGNLTPQFSLSGECDFIPFFFSAVMLPICIKSVSCDSKADANIGIGIFAIWILPYPSVEGPLSLWVPLTTKQRQQKFFICRTYGEPDLMEFSHSCCCCSPAELQ